MTWLHLVLQKVFNIEDRISELNKRYLKNCMRHNNEQIVELISNYKNWYQTNRITSYKTFMCHYREIIYSFQL